MTAVATLLAGIRATSDGLTDLCPEHLRQGIRHLQRNCDIECNAHADETTWDDCKQPDRYDGGRMARALASIPRLIQALEAVEDWCNTNQHLTTDYPAGFGSQDYALDDAARRIRTAVTAALGGGE